MKNKLFLDLHVLQTVPPSCLNRDDTGSPKTAIYGGARRARVSSQSWKRAMRTQFFRERFEPTELGFRSKFVFKLIADKVQEHPQKGSAYTEDSALKAVKDLFKKTGLLKESKTEDGGKVLFPVDAKDENKLKTLFFISDMQAKNIAEIIVGDIDESTVKAAIIETLKKNMGVELALFGRMVAADAALNCDASAQVAHAISTHRVENDSDFFTAVDDLSREMDDHAGAGHLDTIEYNSATLYRYATVAVHDLFGQLAHDTAALEKAVREFSRAFIGSIPTGKQNTFAAHTLPDAVLAAIRADRPLNLAGAFEKPVRDIGGNGFVEPSALALTEYAQSAYQDFCAAPAESYIVGRYLDGLGERLTLDDMLLRLSHDIARRFGE